MKGIFVILSTLFTLIAYSQVQKGIVVDVDETQFATELRLQNEPESVEEIHFIPGTPFFTKGKITYKF